jgi:hypothetical protein
MTSLKSAVVEAGVRLGLPSVRKGGLAVGLKDGYPVQITAGHAGNRKAIIEFIRYGDPGSDQAVREAIQGSSETGAIKARRLQVENGLVVYQHPKRVFGSEPADAVASEFEGLLRAVKRAAAPATASCRLCGSSTSTELILLNGVVDRACPSCIERFQHDVTLSSARYEDRPMHLLLAILVAAILAVVSSIAWAGMAIVTNQMFWVIAIGSGLLIGWGATRAAGKGGRPVQLVAALFTVLSVLLGQVLFIAWQVNQYLQSHGMDTDWSKFVANVPGLLWETGEDTLFALGGGLLGAYFAIGRASKPMPETSIERLDPSSTPRT